MIVFVGDKPSKKNKDPKVPFVGTPSYRKLLEWIFRMDVDISDVKMSNKGDDTYLLWEAVWKSKQDQGPEEKNLVKFVALGRQAQKYMTKRKVNCFYLPHPSGLNRMLNDTKYLTRKLRECSRYLTASE